MGCDLCFSNSADVIGFDIAGQQVNSAGNMAFTEIVTLTQVDHHRIFFIDKTRRFTTGDDLTFDISPLKVVNTTAPSSAIHAMLRTG
ncbi:Uncharacterised protein [Klebsiella pneumoniae]|uniref:Uncharacterized protein n=1 Tax=Klebsiella pneumoniae TaxID=573 RepID=A0A377VTC5_KLEPN|nr:Uncharacterised protein [Klebsiella pneumoniae]